MRISAKLTIIIIIVSTLIPATGWGTVNLAHLYGVASANATYDGLVPAQVIDANWETGWAAPGAGSAGNPFWLQIDLQQNYQVGRIVLVFAHTTPGYTNIYNLYNSSDGTNWNLIRSGTLVDSIDPKIYVTTIYLTDYRVMRYLKYEVVGGTHWAGMDEIEIWQGNITAPSSLLLLD